MVNTCTFIFVANPSSKDEALKRSLMRQARNDFDDSAFDDEGNDDAADFDEIMDNPHKLDLIGRN